MSKSILKSIIKVVFLLKTTFILAQTPIIELSPKMSHYDIGKSMSYFEDKSEKLTLEQILSSEIDKKFVLSKSEALVFGITTSSFWVKINVRNNKPLQLPRWILTLDYPPLDYITLFQKDKNGNWQNQESGDRLPFSTRAIPHYKFGFILSMPDTLLHTYYLRVKTGGSVIIGTHIEAEKYFVEDSLIGSIGYGFFIGALIIMLFYNLFLYISLKDISYFAYVLFILNNLFLQLCYSGHISQYVFPDNPEMANRFLPIGVALMPISMAFFTITFLNTKRFTPIIHKILLAIAAYGLINLLISVFFSAHIAGYSNGANISISLFAVIIAGVVNVRRGNRSARFFLLAWSFVVIGGAIISLKSFGVQLPNFVARNGTMISSLIEIALLSIALADKYNLFKKEKDIAQSEILTLQENANKVLEQKVTERTAELNKSLANLKITQNQLIQKEKLASLGELTAGIAHEIQNPLNFVNNFAELSIGIAKELKEEIERPEIDKEYIDEIILDLTQNQEKINFHGKRASSIVSGMLEHSRASTGERALTDINKLADEYLRLSYHGLRAKDKNFNSDFTTDFDENLPKIEVIPQDIGRVLLNIINNAFYAVASTSLSYRNEYSPKVIVNTRLLRSLSVVEASEEAAWVEIRVTDNGTGMSEATKAKIFQPFFTTKPTGQGTGLGLSLAYDIVTKGHGGTLEVESVEGEGSTFIIQIPTK